MTSDVVIEKINIIRRWLGRINEVTGGDAESLENIDKQDIFILNLQRAIQACIDLAQIIISDHNWSLPDTYRESFNILGQKKVIDRAITRQMKNMCGFRNIAIHEYQNIDLRILQSILEKELVGLEKYYLNVLEFLDRK